MKGSSRLASEDLSFIYNRMGPKSWNLCFLQKPICRSEFGNAFQNGAVHVKGFASGFAAQCKT